MEKDLESSRPEGIPPAPHPYPAPDNKRLEEDSETLEQSFITDRLREDLIGIVQDIDLNYKRLHYKNPAIKLILVTISGVLKNFIDLLDFPDKDELLAKSKGLNNNAKGFNFGVTEEDIT